MAGVKGRSGDKKKPITPRMKEAARMSAEGMTQKAIAKQLNVTQPAVSYWLDRPEVIQLRDAHLTKMIKAMLGKAYGVLSAQLDSENEWVRQGAAREVVRIAERHQEIDDRTIEVEFLSMPAPGKPMSAEDDKEASQLDILEADEITDA